MIDDLSTAQIQDSLTGRFGALIRSLDEIGSTNTEGLDWALCGGPEGSIVVTDHQTGGRGRWGRSWFSAPGKLLQFSLILRPNLPPSRAGILTTGLGVACTRAIRSLTDLPVQIKWPNDVVIDGRKLAGMLVETTTMGSAIDAAVCGIGVNVHLEKDQIPLELRDRASSLAIELEGRPVPRRSMLLARIVDEIEALYPAVTGDASPLLAEAAQLSAVLGREVVVRFADGSTIIGRADSFDDAGGLRIATGAELVTVRVGEIEQLRARHANEGGGT